jgi:hypothetical protein
VGRAFSQAQWVPAPRERTLGDLKTLQRSVIATIDETLEFIEQAQLHELGCGVVDLSLLASVLLTPKVLLWTLDKDLENLAARFSVAFRATGR